MQQTGDRWSMELEMELEVKVTIPECQSGVPGSTHAKVSQPDAAWSLHI